MSTPASTSPRTNPFLEPANTAPPEENASHRDEARLKQHKVTRSQLPVSVNPLDQTFVLSTPSELFLRNLQAKVTGVTATKTEAPSKTKDGDLVDNDFVWIDGPKNDR